MAKRSLPAAQPMVLLANHHHFAPGESLTNRRVRSRMLLWCIEGAGVVTVNREAHRLGPGEGLLFPWDHTVRYEADPKRPFFVGGVHIVPDYRPRNGAHYAIAHGPQAKMPDESCRHDASWEGLAGVVRLPFAETSAIRHLCEYAVVWFQRGPQDEGTARFLGERLRHEAARATASPCGGALPHALREAMDLAQETTRETLRVEDLAAAGECSPATLTRLFRRHTGRSPMQWVRQKRMETAARLLSTTGMRIAEVGRAAGISDPYHFSRLFRNHFGESPRRYRQRMALMG